MRNFLTLGITGLALVAAITVLGSEPGYAQGAVQTTLSGPTPTSERFKVGQFSGHPFDIRQCFDDERGCQLATCVNRPTQDGTVTVCQSHGANFP
jgi:hypothetical protein